MGTLRGGWSSAHSLDRCNTPMVVSFERACQPELGESSVGWLVGGQSGKDPWPPRHGVIRDGGIS